MQALLDVHVTKENKWRNPLQVEGDKVLRGELYVLITSYCESSGTRKSIMYCIGG